jgi:pimeloyl-ACP methyl ester carboxylesterase
MAKPSPRDDQAPPLSRAIGEVPAWLELRAKSFGRRPRAAATRSAPPVLVLPGFLGSDASTRPLRHALVAAGYDVHGWGFGMNFGVSIDLFLKIEELALRLAGSEQVTLIGWSLGGLVAREIALRQPERIAQVVTLGSPFSGDLKANNAWWLYEWMTGRPVDQPAVPIRRGEKPAVPTIALWSANDGIIAPACARGLPHESDRIIEVDGTHLGYMTCPNVAATLAELLGS